MRRPRFALALLALSACTRGPSAIAYGKETCDVCRMEITDPRYGAEVITRTGKARKFDGLECLARYIAEAPDRGAVRGVWVSDFTHPGTFLRSDSARFVRAAGTRNEMGQGWLAVPASMGRDAVVARFGAEPIAWGEVVTLAARGDLDPGHDEVAPAAPVARASGEGAEVVVSPTGAVRSLGAALRQVRSGGVIRVEPGTYREPTIVVDRPVTIEGIDHPTFDGEGAREILRVVADDVTVRGLRFANVGTSYLEDRAALRVTDARGCAIVGNRLDDAFFGIYLARVTRCRVEGNVIRGAARTETSAGNGIHLWNTRDVVIAGNQVSGQRDGIYFEFVHDADVHDNVSEGNLRYGLHFMYSDDCAYTGNTFRRNGSGVAVMYTHRVRMTGNRFEDNWGSAAYGLLLKEISDSRLEHNVFDRNTTGLFVDGADRLHADHNEFTGNGWALRLEANSTDAWFTRNDFIDNTFDVATNGRELHAHFGGNYWSAYTGYDLDRDGVGDVPHRPVRVFSMVVQQNPPSLMLLRSGFVDLLDAAERALPALTPATLADTAPAMRPVP